MTRKCQKLVNRAVGGGGDEMTVLTLKCKSRQKKRETRSLLLGYYLEPILGHGFGGVSFNPLTSLLPRSLLMLGHFLFGDMEVVVKMLGEGEVAQSVLQAIQVQGIS